MFVKQLINFENSIPFWQMTHSQLFHQILYFPSEFFLKTFIENVNISETNVVSVQQAQVLR